MARDIEEFLKMAAKRRQQQKKAGGAGGGRPAGQGGSAGQQSPPAARKPLPATPRPPQPRSLRPASDDEIVVIGSSAEPDPYKQSVSQHVKSHIDTSDLVEHASHLGEEVALADDRMDSRMQSTFEHRIGSLDSSPDSAFSTTTTTTAKDVSPIADDLLNMLSNPKSIRQAILINEILTRPNFD